MIRLVLVEDNPGDVELFRYALDQASISCDLTVIENGSDALAFVRQMGRYPDAPLPDLVIVDLNLPRYDGIEILQAMRANMAFAEVPVAVLSSSSSPRDRVKIEAFGVGRYITNPTFAVEADFALNSGGSSR
jgi:two-component system, chemotaxis family, response regulator Rcp1